MNLEYSRLAKDYPKGIARQGAPFRGKGDCVRREGDNRRLFAYSTIKEGGVQSERTRGAGLTVFRVRSGRILLLNPPSLTRTVQILRSAARKPGLSYAFLINRGTGLYTLLLVKKVMKITP